MKLLPTLCMFLVSIGANAQIINTIAGNGTPGYSGDGGSCVSAELNQPDAIAINAAGDIYFSDWGNNCIRKIAVSGVITTIAGVGSPGYSGDGGPASAAFIDNPTELYIDNTGNIYFVDGGNDVIREISATGIISTVAGNGTPGFSGDGGPATAAQLNTDVGLTFDRLGNMYIGDFGNNRVRKVNTSGIISTYAGTGATGYGSDGVPATSTTLYHPNFLLTDSVNNLFISDNANHRIRKVDASGIISTFIGNGIGTYAGDGGPATAASIYFPGGFAFDASGNFYLADYSNSRIRKVNTLGIISTIAGTGGFGYSGDGIPATAAELNYPVYVAFNMDGNLLVSDFYNNRMRIIENCGAVTAQPAGDTVLEGASVIYSVTTSMTSPSYQWQGNAGTGFVNLTDYWPYSGVTTNELTISDASIFLNNTSYRCVVSNGACADTSTGAILMIQGNAGVNNIYTHSSLVLYPNPATTQLNILSTGGSINQVAITNLLGQSVYNRVCYTSHVQIDVTDLPAGVYFVRVNDTEMKRFVKE